MNRASSRSRLKNPVEYFPLIVVMNGENVVFESIQVIKSS